MIDRFPDWTPPVMEHGQMTKYLWTVWHPENLKLGYKTDIGAFTVLLAHNGITLEDYVEIGSHCVILSKSTIDGKDGPVVLKKNCKIGTHSTVMPGVTVGENSIIGAHSYVNRNIPANVVAYGIPVQIKTQSSP